jgi:hypothetical protein
MKITAGILLACSLAFSACNGRSPAAPAPVPLNLAGTWTGTWTFVSGGATVTDAATVTLAQTDTSAAGSWSSASGPGGQLAFTVGASVTGTISLSQTLLNGVNCSASTTVVGTATSTQLKFTLAALTPTGLCQWATNQQFTFSR